MRRILNLLITGAVLGCSAWLFPDVVQIDGLFTLVAATVLLWLISMAVSWLSIIIMMAGAVIGSGEGVLLGFLVFLSSQVITLYILSANMPGFTVEGFWAKVLIVICCGVYSLVAARQAQKDKPNS